MIDYFMVPFAAPSENEAMASISHEVNREDISAAIQNAPHHFELYSLGEIDDNGIINPKKELICDCSSLVRAKRQPAESEARRSENPPGANRTGTNGAANAPGAGTSTL